MTIRAGFIGCVSSSQMGLETLLKVSGIKICAVITAEKKIEISDYADLSPICLKHKIPMHFEDSSNKNLSRDFLASYNLDIIFCIGWSRLLSNDILSLTPHGVVGFHPAALPSNRGRHPIIWSLVLGLKDTASTFFLMDEGADTGPILSQVPIKISDSDNSSTLYQKILKVAKEQILDIALDLVNGNLNSKEQDHSGANNWRKRNEKDGLIDFRMSAQSIYNLIRALAPPYPGAEFHYKGSMIKVLESVPVFDGVNENFEPGKVLDKKKGDILVKTEGSSAIWLIGIENKNISLGDYL